VRIVCMFLVGVWLIGCSDRSVPSQPPAASAPTDPSEKTRAEILAEFNSTEEHWATLKAVGDNMLALGYHMDDKGTPLEPKFVEGHLRGPFFHIHVPDAAPYKMEWRLTGLALSGGDEVPVSFLLTNVDGPFNHDAAIATVKEFQRAAGHRLDVASVKAAMKDAEARFAKRKSEPVDDLDPKWMIVSDVVKDGDYAYRVDIGEWPPEEYTRENGSSKVTVYVVYLTPGKEIDLTKVSGGGFWDQGN